MLPSSFRTVALRPSLFTLGLLAAFPLLAQDPAVRAGGASAPEPQPAGADPGRDATTLDRIIVKGEKTDRTLQDTAASVAVTTSARIEQENLQSLLDILNRTPNVATMYGNSGYTIRGIPSESNMANPMATTYIDGAALHSQAEDSAPTDLWDIAQVELFRGPQSTVQGQNALAGAIVMRTEDPTMDWSGRARLLLSDPSDRRVSFAGGGPLVEDELAFRVALDKRDFDGFVRNTTRNAGEDAVDSTTARAKLLWTPRGLDGLTARLAYTRNDREGPYRFSYSRGDVPDFYQNRINTSNRPNVSDVLSQVANLQVDYDFGGPWTLSSVTSWSNSDLLRDYDNDKGPLDTEYGHTDEDYTVASQELRLHYAGARLNGLVGVYASRRERDNAQTLRTHIDTPVATIAGALQGFGLDAGTASAVAGLYAQALPAIPVDYVSSNAGRSENRALFADGEFAFNERWSALAGFRYDRETYGFGSDSVAQIAGALPDPAAFAPVLGPLAAPVIGGINQFIHGVAASASAVIPWSESDFTAFLPKAGLRWSWDADRSLAFTVQRGYRSGGSSFNTARARAFAYDPEYTLNYELALRTQWLGGRLAVNANTYYIDWKDKQVGVYFDAENVYDYHVINAAKAHLYGFEAETRYFVNEHFDWYAGLGHARTRYDEFELPAGAITDPGNPDRNGFSGREFAYAPRWTFSLGGNFRWSESWFANLNANFRDEMQVDAGAGNHVLSSRVVANFKLGYENPDWSAYVFAYNLSDKGYLQYVWRDSPDIILGAPRVVGIGLESRW